MKSDGAVVINTALDNKGIEKGLKGVSGALGGLKGMVANLALSIVSTVGNLVKTIISMVSGLVVSIVAALGVAVVSITKQSTDAYADYEQIAGGVETLLKGAASKVKSYAEDAFYTSSVSANEYMETVTGFSASLISSLAGDTEKAADIANMAMIDMADNANKMGTPIENIKTAYAGFAKQQYMLLDNLKLGYGGTKTEMQRLLKDAQAFSGIKYDINNLADVYSAIHAIQQKLGIAGATTEEAERTITGSGNMTKAAWKNVLTAISGGGDLDKAINNLVFSVSKYFENIVPVVERSLYGVGQLIEKIAPQLVQTVAVSLIRAIPGLLSAVYQMIIGLAKGIYQGITALFSGKGFSTEIKASLNNVSDGFASASSGAEDLEQATEAAGKAAKKSLAGFDELNVLADQSGAGTQEDVSGIGVIPTVAVDTVIDEGGFTSKTNVISEFIGKIKEELVKLEAILKPTGGAIEEHFARIVNAAQKALPDFKNGLDGYKSGFIDLYEYIAYEFVPNIANTWATDLVPIFSDGCELEIEEIGKSFKWLGGLFKDISNNIIIPSLALVERFTTKVFRGIKKEWDKSGGALLKEMREAFENVRTELSNLYYGFVEPIWASIMKHLERLNTEGLAPLLTELWGFALEVGTLFWQLYNAVIKPIADLIIKYVFPVIIELFDDFLEDQINGTIIIQQGLTNIIAALRGVVQFISGVFAGDWERAWAGVKKTFSVVWQSIEPLLRPIINVCIGLLNGLISGIVSGLNTAIRAINRIKLTIPDWIGGKVGGKSIGFSLKEISVPSIPYLAKGAVLPANKPFMAVVGDQRHGTNVEAPLTTIQEAVAVVMEDFIASNMAGHEATVAMLREILEAILGIQIGDDVIASAYDRYRQKMAIVNGG